MGMPGEPRPRAEVHDPLGFGQDVGHPAEAVEDVARTEMGTVGGRDDPTGHRLIQKQLFVENETRPLSGGELSRGPTLMFHVKHGLSG